MLLLLLLLLLLITYHWLVPDEPPRPTVAVREDSASDSSSSSESSDTDDDVDSSGSDQAAEYLLARIQNQSKPPERQKQPISVLREDLPRGRLDGEGRAPVRLRSCLLFTSASTLYITYFL